MMPQTVPSRTYHPVPRTRTVAVVSRDTDEHLVDVVLGTVGHDIVLVEPTVHAYSHIRRVQPDLVIVCMSSNDAEGCQVLSMLMLDCKTARIPVLAYVASVDEAGEGTALPVSVLN